MDPFKLSIFSGPTSSLIWLLLFFLLNPPVLLPLMLGKMCLLLINRVMISNTESVSLFSSNARACQHTTEKGANLSLLLLLAPLGGTCCTYSRLRSYITLAVLPTYACAPQDLAPAHHQTLLGCLSLSSQHPHLGYLVWPLLKETKPSKSVTAELELWFQPSRGRGMASRSFLWPAPENWVSHLSHASTRQADINCLVFFRSVIYLRKDDCFKQALEWLIILWAS